MPMTPQEQDRYEKLVAYELAVREMGEQEPVLSPGFVAQMISGYVRMRDEIASLRERVTTLEGSVIVGASVSLTVVAIAGTVG